MNLVVAKLRVIAAKIEERDDRRKASTTSIQRLHRSEMALVLEAIRGWANHLEDISK